MYKFIKTKDEDNEFENTNVEISIPHNYIDISKLLEAFEDFIKGCGFIIDNNSHLDFVVDDSSDIPNEIPEQIKIEENK